MHEYYKRRERIQLNVLFFTIFAVFSKTSHMKQKTQDTSNRVIIPNTLSKTFSKIGTLIKIHRNIMIWHISQIIPAYFSDLAVLNKRNSQNILAFKTAPFYLVMAVCSSLYDRVITISFSIFPLREKLPQNQGVTKKLSFNLVICCRYFSGKYQLQDHFSVS